VIVEAAPQQFEFARDFAPGFVELGAADELVGFAAEEFYAETGQAEERGEREDELAGELDVILGKHSGFPFYGLMGWNCHGGIRVR